MPTKPPPLNRLPGEQCSAWDFVNCRGTVNHRDERGEPSCCECWPLAFDGERVPKLQRCRYCPA